MTPSLRTVAVDALARVEGEGGLRLVLRGGAVAEATLSIFEPPRYFEALLRGRSFAEVPDITARICGICPVAYQMSAVHAIEAAFGATVTPEIRALRRLLYCGEWIASHALHIHLLHAPDFLGYPSAVEMAREHGDAVRRGLALQQAGNALMALIGGRAVHPVGVRPGGFWKAPERAAVAAMAGPMARARDDALAAVRWVASLPFPAAERAYSFLALRHDADYPFCEGRIALGSGPAAETFAVDAFDTRTAEHQVPHSTALHGRLADGTAYLTGPLARYALNRDRLRPVAREAADAAGLGPVCRNPFRAIVVRAIEVLQACDEAVDLIAAYAPPDPPAVPLAPRAATGAAATEAPRGLLWHRYTFEADGAVAKARIVPPTSQNQPSIEDDLRRLAPGWLDLPDDALRARCEQAVRNHDPCISCATHFLRLDLDRGP